MSTRRILIADDHPIVRLGLRAILAHTEFEVVAEATNGNEAYALAGQFVPDLALLDVRMPVGDGLRCLARLRTSLPTVQVVMLSSSDNPIYLARALALGAAGYLTKDTRAADLLLSLRVVAAGEQLWSRHKRIDVRRHLAQERETPGSSVFLTHREREVLQQLALGLSNREIADSLHISPVTVKDYVSTILKKLAVADRTQAAVRAIREHLV